MTNQNNDYTWWFLFISVFNTNLGLSNREKNERQEKRQISIENKLDKILEILKNEQQ